FEQWFTRFGVDRFGRQLDDGSFTLVVDAADRAGRIDFTFDRNGAVERDGLFTVNEHRRVEGADLRHRRGAADAENDRHRGQNLLLDAIGVLRGKGKLVGG